MKTIFIFVPFKILIFQLKDDEEAAADGERGRDEEEKVGTSKAA